MSLLHLYMPLVGWVGLGWMCGRLLPLQIPYLLGKYLFWCGVPLSVIGFLYQADLSGPVWLASLVAWGGISTGLPLMWSWIQWQIHRGSLSPPLQRLQQPKTQASLLLVATLGNTGYLGYPVILALVGAPYFGWAIFYDMATIVVGAYGIGVLLASRLGQAHRTLAQAVQAIVINPTLWSCFVGMALRSLTLPSALVSILQAIAWSSVVLALLLIGMRLSQLATWNHVRLVSVSLGIKLLLLPLTMGILLSLLGFDGAPRLVMVLQAAMPPAFSTLVLAENFELDRETTVTALALGSVALLITLPVWVWLFPV
ncbi:AEC family transporter [Leptolyngbya sp. FACHB-16]|nr:AEC family transporter [Leptolyngbya sp. FACHB-8]MBD2158258.1 AEC family transporter [Leptolyngbya sp. FACHB-16]